MARIILQYPPVSSPWHLPAGIAALAAILKNEGNEVVQSYGHIKGLEYVLREHGGADVERALAVVRNPHSDINALYNARMTFERVSRGIPTQDKFEVARNNVSFVSSYYDGSIEQALEAIKNRVQHLWYDYFTKVELPFVRDFKPDLYGISIADERQFIQGLILASMVKDEFPGCVVVLGGNFWSRVTHVFQLPEFARFFNHCDAIVYREGFQPLQQLASTLSPARASGVVWSSGGDVVVNPASQSPTNFETLPTPDFDGGASQWSPDFVPSLYTASNCYMQCGFCAIGGGSDTFLQKPRTMSPRRIAEHMVALGAIRFEITDELFPIPQQIALGKELLRLNHPATWECYLTVTDQLLKPEVCAKLYEAGCRAVQLGLETLSPDTLSRENKQWNTPKNYGVILANLKEVGIQTHVFLIVGIPGEPLHWGLAWTAFLEEHGDNILTVKSGRYRLTRHSPEEIGETHSQLIEVMQDVKPLHLNRDFRYRSISRKKVEATRDILEQACRRHWAFGVTSTIPWWVNRGRYTWDELKRMAQVLPPEQNVRHLDNAIVKANTIVKTELGRQVSFGSFDDVATFAHTLL
ncbi:radical SAM protein [Candidatus Uhrbacteria bacterium]|nr:radical SAM protein [Candidatus Uhrbacteria bacterium]